MLIHDIIKMKYVNLGYIKKNYPYHLISDEEMFNAFIDLGNAEFNERTTMIDPNVRLFNDYYPNPFAEDDYIYEKKNSNGEVVERISLSEVYSTLKSYIISCIQNYLAGAGALPNWVYTYMLGEVIYNSSEYLDIQDLLTAIDSFNIDNEFTREACVKCFIISLRYVSTGTVTRPPTIFGEPHIIKMLRTGK